MYMTLFDIVNDFYTDLNDDYHTYLALCENYDLTADSYNSPHSADTYELSAQAFGKNLNILKNLSYDPEKEKALLNTSGIKYLKLQIDIINRLYIAFDDMFFYLKTLVELFASESPACLFSLVADLNNKINSDNSLSLLNHMRDTVLSIDERVKTELNYDLDIDYNRVNFYFMISEQHADESNASDINDTYASTANDASPDDYEDCDTCDILSQLCNFAEYSDEKYDLLNKFVLTFSNMPDKYSKENNVRAFRKAFTEAYFELYEAVFLKYAKSNSKNILVKMFLDYGLLDERLLTDQQIYELINIPPLNSDNKCKVYRMSDWLLKVYIGTEIPSKNEFDQEYSDYVRERKKNEALSATEEKDF